MVGQAVGVSASVQPSDVLPSPIPAGTFTWSVGSYAVGNYQASNNTQYDSGGNPTPGSATYSVGVVLPIILNTEAINFYWVDDGTKTVSCSITGLSCDPSVKFTVNRPAGANVQAQTGTVELHQTGNGGYYLQAGGSASNIGINFTFTVPTGGGSWEWIQLVESTSRSAIEQNGHTAQINVNSLNGSPSLGILDTTLPYEAGLTNGSTTNDNPSEQVNPFVLYPASPTSLNNKSLTDIVSASDSDTFEDWLMYMPPGNGNIWVPVGTVQWKWDGKANRVKDQNGNYTANWLPALGSSAGAITVTQQYQDEKHNFPQWNNNVVNGYYTLQ